MHLLVIFIMEYIFINMTQNLVIRNFMIMITIWSLFNNQLNS